MDLEPTMDRRERAQQIVEEAIPVVEALAEEGAALVEEAEREAYKNLARLQEALEEREQIDKQAQAIRRALAAAPEQLARASLEEDWPTEDRIKENYKKFKSELEGLEERRGEIEQEIRTLRGPNASRKSEPHRLQGELYQRRRIAKALTEAMAPLHELDRLAVRIQGKLNGFKARANDHRAESEALNDVLRAEQHQKNLAERSTREGKALDLARRTRSKAQV